MNTIIKSLLAIGMVSVSAAAFSASTTGCAGGGADVTVSSGGFLVNGFTMKCSANVFLNYDPAQGSPTNTAVTVCSGSKKGSKMYGGSSDGGKVEEKGSLPSSVVQSSVAATSSGC